jgi:hypothetical protein
VYAKSYSPCFLNQKILVTLFSNSDIILEGINTGRENIGQSSFVHRNWKKIFKESVVTVKKYFQKVQGLLRG